MDNKTLPLISKSNSPTQSKSESTSSVNHTTTEPTTDNHALDGFIKSPDKSSQSLFFSKSSKNNSSEIIITIVSEKPNSSQRRQAVGTIDYSRNHQANHKKNEEVSSIKQKKLEKAKPYECGCCQKRFSTLIALEQHCKKAHPEVVHPEAVLFLALLKYSAKGNNI